MNLIYYVEDEESIREALVYALGSSGFEIKGFESSKMFWPALEERKPDLILLDIMLPGEDGIQILKKIRANSRTASIPVILLTAKGSEFEKVIGLDSGADDYVAKPFGVMELISRVKAVLRRIPGNYDEPTKLSSQGIVLDPVSHVVTIDGEETEFALKEFDLLHCLMKNEGRVYTRDDLLDLIWGYETEIETRTVDVHIGMIRKKLGEYGKQIKTVRGLGYKFVGSGE